MNLSKKDPVLFIYEASRQLELMRERLETLTEKAQSVAIMGSDEQTDVDRMFAFALERIRDDINKAKKLLETSKEEQVWLQDWLEGRK
jgi:hypothetical protein